MPYEFQPAYVTNFYPPLHDSTPWGVKFYWGRKVSDESEERKEEEGEQQEEDDREGKVGQRGEPLKEE